MQVQSSPIVTPFSQETAHQQPPTVATTISPERSLARFTPSGESVQKVQNSGVSPYAKKIERRDLNETLVMSLLWKQLSPAGHAALYQCSQHAHQALTDLVAQHPDKKVVIVQDVDDGNSESTMFFAGLVDSNDHMTIERSAEWWADQKHQSYALPGSAQNLADALRHQNVRIAYLSSRGDIEGIRETTADMLASFGFPMGQNTEVRIATGKNPKTRQVSEITEGTGAALFIGDKLSDFCRELKHKPEDREQLNKWVTEKYREDIGVNFIVMTNPVYGPSWENLTHNKSADLDTQALYVKRLQRLESWKDPELRAEAKTNPLMQQLQQALLYMQSASYKALTIQTCKRASSEFNRLMQAPCSKQRVAVMDIDGTALNNTPWLAEHCKTGQMPNQESFNRWALSKQATVKEGIRELVDAYRSKQVPVMWVTERPASSGVGTEDDIRRATEEHLISLGLFQSGDKIIFKQDCEETTSTTSMDKRSCFEAIRSGQYTGGVPCEIVQRVGDSLDDLEIDRELLHNTDASTWPKEARELGTRRILIANPADFQTWHHYLVEHWLQSPKEEVRRKAQEAKADPEKMASLNKEMIYRWVPSASAQAH